MERSEISAKIAELKADEAKAKGTPCEVFSRVVGYLRPVQCWNKGKREETDKIIAANNNLGRGALLDGLRRRENKE